MNWQPRPIRTGDGWRTCRRITSLWSRTANDNMLSVVPVIRVNRKPIARGDVGGRLTNTKYPAPPNTWTIHQTDRSHPNNLDICFCQHKVFFLQKVKVAPGKRSEWFTLSYSCSNVIVWILLRRSNRMINTPVLDLQSKVLVAVVPFGLRIIILISRRLFLAFKRISSYEV